MVAPVIRQDGQLRPVLEVCDLFEAPQDGDVHFMCLDQLQQLESPQIPDLCGFLRCGGGDPEFPYSPAMRKGPCWEQRAAFGKVLLVHVSG